MEYAPRGRMLKCWGFFTQSYAFLKNFNNELRDLSGFLLLFSD